MEAAFLFISFLYFFIFALFFLLTSVMFVIDWSGLHMPEWSAWSKRSGIFLCCYCYQVASYPAVCCMPANLHVQSRVSPNLGFRIWHNSLKNLTNGMPDKIWHQSYLASHWLDFSGYCIISWNLKLAKPDSEQKYLPIISRHIFLWTNLCPL